MVEEVRNRVSPTKELFFPLILLLLVFPPILRDGLLKVQKVQLVIFFVVGVALTFRYYRNDTRLSTILFLLFILFPALYAGAGIFRGHSLYIIGKEVLFFTMPCLLYPVFREACSPERWKRAVLLLGVVAAMVQIVVILGVWAAGAHMARSMFRWHCLYLTHLLMLIALWMMVGDPSRGGIRKWAIAGVLVLGMLATLGRGDFLGMLALLAFSAGGLYRSSKRMRVWIAWLSVVPLLYFVVLSHGVQLSAKTSKAWRVYEVQTFMDFCGPDQTAFWLGNGFGWELPVPRTLYVYASDALQRINKFHDFWLYLLSKTGVVGTVLFWGGLLFLFFWVNERLPDDGEGRFPRFMLGYLAFLCLVAWNYNGGPSMAFQQGALFGLALALAWQHPTDTAPVTGDSP